MTSRDKAAVIIVMWLIAAALSVFVLLGSISRGIDGWSALLVMTLIGSAVGGSIAMTTGTKTVEPPTREQRSSSLGKAKTSDMALADRLIDSMSDDEIAALRRRLMSERGAHVGDDGEVISLEDALRERRS
ncbi:MAG: hypothetical protein IT320_10560 [Anaerolineae bacterium]|nr:hypothetical protein [Anaerolineae bacterium]